MAKTILPSDGLATSAAASAATAAATASAAAVRASESASATAAATAVVSNNIEWMKKSLEEIKENLSTMRAAFVTTAQFKEVVDLGEDHEKRIRGIEQKIWTWMGSIAIITAVVTVTISFLTRFIK